MKCIAIGLLIAIAIIDIMLILACGELEKEREQNRKEKQMKIGDEVYVHGYIDEIRKDVIIIRNEGGYFGTVADDIVQELWTPQAKPKRGTWVGEADGYADGELVYDMWSCSNCGTYFEEWEYEPTWNFCPNCGADMRGESDAQIHKR